MSKIESPESIVSNEEIQKAVSEHLRKLNSGEAELQHAKIFFAGARTLATAVKMDMESSKALGLPLYKRTRAFFGVKD